MNLRLVLPNDACPANKEAQLASRHFPITYANSNAWNCLEVMEETILTASSSLRVRNSVLKPLFSEAMKKVFPVDISQEYLKLHRCLQPGRFEVYPREDRFKTVAVAGAEGEVGAVDDD